jgi:hypothetical protein
MLNEIQTFKQLLDFIIQNHNIGTEDGSNYSIKLNELILDCTKREFLLHQIGGLSTLIMQIQANMPESENDQAVELTSEAKSYIDDYTQLIKELETETNNPFV